MSAKILLNVHVNAVKPETPVIFNKSERVQSEGEDRTGNGTDRVNSFLLIL